MGSERPTDEAGTTRRTRRRRRVRRAALVVAAVLGWLATSLIDVRTVTGVGDWLSNRLPALSADPALVPEEPTLVVTVHGLCRTSGSMERLARTLRAQGYEVLNFGYDSTDALIQDHAAALHAALESHLAAREGPVPGLAFVGHSMGGLVIRSYLSRSDARPAEACVFVATPHRGAALAAARQDFPPFRWFCGDRAALQLLPGDPYVSSLPEPRAPRVGVIYGARGDRDGWNEDIPGDDDGTVGVAEAQLLGGSEAGVVARGFPYGHYRVSLAAEVLADIREFLRHGRFRESG